MFLAKVLIFNYPNLEQMHDDILEVLGWLNRDMQELTILFDDFKFIDTDRYSIREQLRGNISTGDKRKIFRRDQ